MLQTNHEPRNSSVITTTMRRAARQIAGNKYRRGPRNWETHSAPDLSKETVTQLVLRNLAKVQHGNGRDRVVLTDLGREIAGFGAAANAGAVQ